MTDRDPHQPYPTKQFRTQLESQFGFLQASYGFHTPVIGAEHRGFSVAAFESPNLVLKVQYDEFRGELDAYLIRRDKDGNFPAYLTSPDDWISVDALIDYRIQGGEKEPRPADIDGQVQYLATQLGKHGSDLLSGDLTIFSEVRNFIKERAVVSGSPSV